MCRRQRSNLFVDVLRGSNLLWCFALFLPRGAVLLDESPVNAGPNDLVGGNGHSVELTETRN